VRLRNQIDYSLFRHSDRLFIGKDGTLFLRETFDILIDYERGGDACQQGVRAKIKTLARYLARRGIRLVIVTHPPRRSSKRSCFRPKRRVCRRMARSTSCGAF
jgi:hypothetical protein